MEKSKMSPHSYKGELREAVASQKRWLSERGDSVAGYIAFYKDTSYPQEQIIRIYEADRNELVRLEKLLDSKTKKN